MDLEKLKPSDREKAKKYGRAGFGGILLVILVAGAFRPAVLSGIPILWAVVTWLGGVQIIAGVTALLVAIAANTAYVLWEIPVSFVETVKKFKEKHS